VLDSTEIKGDLKYVDYSGLALSATVSLLVSFGGFDSICCH
jgi:hypothetical protein